MLELLIEEVSGHDFADYMQEEILTPLGMNHSSFTWSKDFEPPVPYGYDLKTGLCQFMSTLEKHLAAYLPAPKISPPFSQQA